LSEAVDACLVKLTNCCDKWTEYEKHREKVATQVADIERLAYSFPATAVDSEAEHEPDIARIHVCFLCDLF